MNQLEIWDKEWAARFPMRIRRKDKERFLDELEGKLHAFGFQTSRLTFRKSGAVGISYADQTIIPGGYYIPRVHRPNDNDFSAEKLRPLLTALTEYLEDTLTS
jgi:hypothetical protein